MALSTGTSEFEPYTIHDHPKARRSIEVARSWAALGTWALVTLFSTMANVPLFDSVIRGMIAGFLMFLVVWAMAVTIWKEVVKHEIAQAKERAQEKREKLMEEFEEARRLAKERSDEAAHGGPAEA